MKKKKILILALLGDPTLPAGLPHTGGFNQTLRELLTSLAAFSLPICVITDTSQYSTEKHVQISNYIDLYRVMILESEHENQENLRTGQGRILNDIISILGGNLDDIVLIHSFYWFSGHLAQQLNEIYQIPYIHTPISLAYHKTAVGFEANCPFQVECEPLFLQRANLILAITEQEANILIVNYQVRRSQIIVTGRSVDQVFHNPARDNRGYPRNVSHAQVFSFNETNAPWWNTGAYTYLGRIVPIKGILQIIQSWSALRQRYGSLTPPLWIVGGSPAQISDFRREVMKYVVNLADYEAQQGIVWWGYLDQASISALFLKTLVLVTHSRFEAGGRVILEAMCQGKPVIATPNGFAADYIKDGINGFTVTFGDTARLERCMEFFIRQPYLSCSMGNSAKLTFEQIQRNWNYNGIHRKIYEHYLEGKAVQINSSIPVLPQITCETQEKVDCFPFIDIQFSEAEWDKELSAHFQYPIQNFCNIVTTDAHARHYRCEIGDTSYRIKQFYSRLNENAIWNSCEQTKVLRSTELLCLADKSKYNSEVVPIVFSSGQGNYYILPELERINLDYTAVSNLLEAFGASRPLSSMPLPVIDDKPTWTLNGMSDIISCPTTLEKAIDLLAFSSKDLESSISKKILLYRPQMEKLLSQSYSSARYGFNYGKPPISHIVSRNGRPMLLPTANWYWGELGPDFVVAALQTGEKVHALTGQKDDCRQLLWQVYLAWRNILQAEWNGNSPELLWIQTMSQTLYELGIAKNFLKL